MKFDLLLGPHRLDVVKPQHLADLHRLHYFCNELEAETKEFLSVTSGYRTWEDQKRIYRQINDQRLIQGRTELPIPLHSKHMFGQAVDLADGNSILKNWLREHPDFLKKHDLYCEHWTATPTWLHLQIVPPKSKRTWFYP